MNVIPATSVDGDVASLDAIADYVLAAAQFVGLDKHVTYRLRLAVDEVATNVILHGYAESGTRGQLRLSSTLQDGMLAITLEDTAPPYDPTRALRKTVSALPLEERIAGGLGLILVARSVDAFDYRRVGDVNRNVLKAQLPRPILEQERTARVLVVAPFPAFADELAGRLARWPYTFTVVEDGRAARELLRRERFDLMLLSLDMASETGEPCLRRIAELLAEDAPPVVVLYEEAEADELEQCLGLGAYDFVSLALAAPLLHVRLQSSIDRFRERKRIAVMIARLAELEKLARDFTEVILPLGVALTEETSLPRLMDRIVSEAMSICNADAGTLYLREQDTLAFAIMRTDSLGVAFGGDDQRVPYGALPLHDAVTGRPNFRNVATWAALRRTTVNIHDIYEVDSGFDFSGAKEFDQRTGYRTVSCLTVPLVAGGDVVGVLQLLNAQDERSGEMVPFRDYQERVVTAMASQAAIAVHDHRLLEQHNTFQRLERELQIGQEIQANFLPRDLPDIAGWELAARFIPAREVSGDFYDVFELSDHYVGVVVADVCDKGVGAALFMGLIRSLVRAFTQMDWAPAPELEQGGGVHVTAQHKAVGGREAQLRRLSELLLRGVVRTNQYVAETHRDLNMFATLFFGILVPESGFLAYINAGHIAPQIWREGRFIRHLPTTGPAVGVIVDAPFEVGQTVLERDDILIGYTDGLTDARAADGSRFGKERVGEVIASSPWSAEGVLAALEAAVNRHIAGTDRYDDLSMIGVWRKPHETRSLVEMHRRCEV